MGAIIKAPSHALRTLPDTDRHKVRFDIRSESSDSVYRIAFDAAKGAGYWVCSCRGCISHGQCKHLTACGLRGRNFGKQLDTLKALGL
jgi:hypothetical protein